VTHININKNIGINKIILHYNNDMDDEILEGTISNYIESSLVDVFVRRVNSYTE